MRLLKALLLALFAYCSVSAPLAAQVVFHNNDGVFTSTGNTSGTLSLSGSALIQVVGLTTYGIPATTGSNLGSVSFTTGNVATGSIMSGATFSPGGSFTIVYMNGTIFSGSFGSNTTWTSLGAGYLFSGTVNGMLSVPGYNPATVMGASIQLTTIPSSLTPSSGGFTITDGGGTSSFNLPPGGLTSVVPEPGTLTLLGTGLVGLGVYARRLRIGGPVDTK